ncbi:conserved hypothetical protein [Candidatus Nitrosotenuis uzonensis]|uniref:Uncharacterized protein n=2 Tax=Candidatus Nitrosotenuis uzonensis TaxID=1407055 RepID=A0A812EV25_9ARCH|nr:conserved hypothetical protein [Candidatus Nitrosotenuis uzonensis]
MSGMGIKYKVKINYHTHKFAGEQDLFYNVLHFSASHSCSIFQIGDTDLFYAPFYFSDGTLTDINIYYLKSEKLRNALKDTKVIRFSPGTGEWLPMKGDLKDTYAWFFVSKIISTTSKEIQEILNMEESLQNNVTDVLTIEH